MWRILLVLAMLVGNAAADDPKFVFGSHDDVKDVKVVEWAAAAEAGVVLTTGNSETTTATGGFKVSRKDGADKLAIEASGAYAKSGVRVIQDLNGNGLIDNPSEITTQETVSAETLQSKLRYDRFLTEFNSLFIAALASRDIPAGKESAFGGQLGYSRQLYKSTTAETVGEIGYDFSRETLTTGTANSIHSARGFVGHKATLIEGTQLDTSLELLSNVNRETLPTGKDGGPFKDTRINFRISVQAKIGLNMAIQMAFEARYDNRPGPMQIKMLAPGFVPEADSLDTIMKASFIYTFAGAKPEKK